MPRRLQGNLFQIVGAAKRKLRLPNVFIFVAGTMRWPWCAERSLARMATVWTGVQTAEKYTLDTYHEYNWKPLLQSCMWSAAWLLAKKAHHDGSAWNAHSGGHQSVACSNDCNLLITPSLTPKRMALQLSTRLSMNVVYFRGTWCWWWWWWWW